MSGPAQGVGGRDVSSAPHGGLSDPRLHMDLASAAQIDELHGAVVDKLGPAAAAVQSALKTAPRGWTLYGRGAEPASLGDGAASLWIAGGLAGSALDSRDAAPRPLSHDDAAAFCRLADALLEVTVIEPPCPGGPTAEGRLQGLATAFADSGKHLLAVCLEAREVRAVLHMARAVAGSDSALRERPLVTIAAAGGDAQMVAQLAAESGVPALVAVTPSFLGTPQDARAALVDAVAQGLQAAAAVQQTFPGAPVGIAVPPSPRPPLHAGAVVGGALAAQLVHSFGLPVTVTLLSTTARAPGWLASAENTYAALGCALAGVDGVAGAGLVAGGAAVSLHQLALDAEITSYVRKTVAGILVDHETLAEDTIARVGIAGNSLGERHTRVHMRDVWRPRFFDRTPHEQWLQSGRAQSYELADAYIDRVLADHDVVPLADAVADAIANIARSSLEETP